MPLKKLQYSVLTLLFVTLHIYASEGQISTCDMMSRPHPHGHLTYDKGEVVRGLWDQVESAAAQTEDPYLDKLVHLGVNRGGICGSLLAQAHSNLCFLLRQTYPHLFRSKRSTTVASFLDKVYGVPLPVLSDVTFRGSNWNALLEPFPKAFSNPSSVPRAITELSIVNNENKLRRINDLPLFTKHKNLKPRIRREISQTSMVCDCCFNVCTPSHLATYC